MSSQYNTKNQKRKKIRICINPQGNILEVSPETLNTQHESKLNRRLTKHADKKLQVRHTTSLHIYTH